MNRNNQNVYLFIDPDHAYANEDTSAIGFADIDKACANLEIQHISRAGPLLFRAERPIV